MAKKTVSTRIKQEKEKLETYFQNLPENKKTLADNLIERAAWMKIQCEDLEAYLEVNGWTEKFQQSEKLDPYDRARPQGQTYQTLNASYQKIIRQLEHMMPQGTAEADDGFDALMNSDE